MMDNRYSKQAFMLLLGLWSVVALVRLDGVVIADEAIEFETDIRPMLEQHCYGCHYGSGNADGNKHTHSDLPIVLAGNAGGALTPGRFVDHQSKPLTNLYLSMAERMGVQDLKRFGDSTDRLSNL